MSSPPASWGTPSLQRLAPDNWSLWRAIRLRALGDSPDAFGSTLAREKEFTESDWREYLAEGITVVVLDAGRPVACSAVFSNRPGSAAVVAMWVEPAHRGRGHSRWMLDALVAWACERGLAVEIGVNRANPVARAAYEDYGFVATSHCHPLRDDSDQVCDVLELSTDRVRRG